ncbi:MAG: 50S ribosomal protein L6 [Clostridia bacterium]|nr:50S ribosomal protein L6 [Clostridia bacterium]MBQ5956790.1 50S ribosomal protein L6 [Clostridia bacterium]
MSRIGRQPVKLPANVTAEVGENNEVIIKGPKGELKQTFSGSVTIEKEDNSIVIKRSSDERNIRALHGLTRAIIANMVHGVTEGYQKGLDIVGVGYRAQLQGNKLVMALGFSHPVEIVPEEGITFEVPTANKIIVKGIDKHLVGQVAASIRAIKPPEPYNQKGIRYENEHVIKKEGKKGK